MHMFVVLDIVSDVWRCVLSYVLHIFDVLFVRTVVIGLWVLMLHGEFSCRMCCVFLMYVLRISDGLHVGTIIIRLTPPYIC